LDNFTHTLFGLTMARTPLARAGRGTTAALLLSSNAPDIDIVTLAGGSVSYLRWHRGPTHGPLGIVGLGVITAGLVWIGRRVYDRRRAAGGERSTDVADQNASFPMLVSVSIIGAVVHVLMDLPTSYGTRLLSPFDWHWFAIDLMPIIDIYLLIVLAAGLLFGLRSPAARRRNALIILTLTAANYGVRAVAHHQAIALVPRLFGPTLPQPCDSIAVVQSPLDWWPRTRAPIANLESGRRCLVEVAAVPTFTSPFTWRIIAQLSNAYEIRDLDLRDPRFRALRDGSEGQWRLTRRYPNVWTSPVLQAATTHLGRVFLGFSRFPAARSAVDSRGVTTVRWTDVRFIVGMISLDQPRRGPDIFTATVRIGADGQVLQETLGP
jgi:membrane-bound metal-dependent hydrolase YbcI (DUF457 family)